MILLSPILGLLAQTYLKPTAPVALRPAFPFVVHPTMAPASFSSSPNHFQSIADHRLHCLVPRQKVWSIVDAPSIIHWAKPPPGNLAQLSSGPGFVCIDMGFWSSMCPKPVSALPFLVVCFAFCFSLAGCLYLLGQGFGLELDCIIQIWKRQGGEP